MRFLIYISLLVIICISNVSVGYAQITGVGENFIQLTSYITGKQDSIFVFCVPNPSDEVGELIANTKLGGNPDFTWYKYNETSGIFDSITTQFSASSSTRSNLADGGHRVTTTNGEEFTAWIFNSYMSADPIVVDSTSCDYLQLTGDTTVNQLTYYDYNNGDNPIVLDNGLIVSWTSIPESFTGSFLNVFPEVPSVETTYNLVVANDFGCSDIESVVINEKTPGPNFSFETDKDTTDKQDAPLEITFTDESDNPGIYSWYIYFYLDMDKTMDSLFFTSSEADPVFILERPGHYRTELFVTSPQGCIDSLSNEHTLINEIISVDSVELQIPNFFSPNGDNRNDVFILNDYSIQNINISIFTRWGTKVHEYEGPMENWEGWDGKVKHTNRDALSGVYYYVIYFYGWDEISYKDKKYTGFLHLFRGE